MKYNVRITETLSNVIAVNAETAEEAIAKAREKYFGCDVILISENLDDTTFEIEELAAILVERDYKGIYERFALTPAEFAEEFPEVTGNISGPDTCTLAPLVHIWFCPCNVHDNTWKTFFEDMSWGFAESDVSDGNLACIRYDMAKSLRQYLPKDLKEE